MTLLDEAQRGSKELNKHEHTSFYGNCGLGLFGEKNVLRKLKPKREWWGKQSVRE